MQAKQSYRIVTVLVGVIFFALLAFTSTGYAQEAGKYKFSIGAGMGISANTPDDTAFATGVYADYYLTRDFSIGPLVQMGFTRDLFQIGVTGQAKYAFTLPGVPNFRPHVQAGIGFIYADLEARDFRPRENDSSFLIPLGIGAEYKLTERVILDTSVLFNFTNLDVQDRKFFVTWLIGVKFPF